MVAAAVGRALMLIGELENRRLWVEWKTMHECLRVYYEALESMGDIDSQVAIDTRYIGEVACEGADFMKYFGGVAFEDDLPSVSETAAYDLASLCQFAHEARFDCEKLMLQQLLALDAEESSQSHRQRRGLRGVRLAQTKLAVYYLAAGEEAKARLVAQDMCDMSADVKASIREELAEESPPHFWEVVDRGRNLHYLTGPERAKLDTFLGWLGEARA